MPVWQRQKVQEVLPPLKGSPAAPTGPAVRKAPHKLAQSAASQILLATLTNIPHFALWTKPDAPFLSLEAWAGHADPEGFEGELFDRPSIIRLPMGHAMRHLVTLTWRQAEQAGPS